MSTQDKPPTFPPPAKPQDLESQTSVGTLNHVDASPTGGKDEQSKDPNLVCTSSAPTDRIIDD